MNCLSLVLTTTRLSPTAPCRRLVVVVADRNFTTFFLSALVGQGYVVLRPLRSSVWQGSCRRCFAGTGENRAL